MLEQYEKSVFAAPVAGGHTITHDVYTRGSGPVIVVLQELPGLDAKTLEFADRLVGSGFCVVLPHFLGPLGKTSLLGNLVRVFCLRREFTLFARNATSPIVDWLRALCQQQRDVHQVPGVGVVGMCLTGNFAMSLMADDSVLAGVASQPSMPFGTQAALHMAPAEVTAVAAALDTKGPMHAYRFTGDKLCQQPKFDTIHETFNANGERVRLKSLRGSGHSVFTHDFDPTPGSETAAALAEITGYFASRLATPVASSA